MDRKETWISCLCFAFWPLDLVQLSEDRVDHSNGVGGLGSSLAGVPRCCQTLHLFTIWEQIICHAINTLISEVQIKPVPVSRWFQTSGFLPHQSEQTPERLCHRSVVGSFETSLWPACRSATKTHDKLPKYYQFNKEDPLIIISYLNIKKKSPGVPLRTTLRINCGCWSRQIGRKNTCRGEEGMLNYEEQVY